MDDVSTMRPATLFFKWGRAALMLNSIPLRLVANTSSQALSLISSNFTGGKMPAFAQRMSTPPNSAATRRHDLFHIPLLFDVASTEYYGAAAASQGLHRRGSVRFVPSKQTDPGAELGEDPSDALANALGSTSHDH